MNASLFSKTLKKVFRRYKGRKVLGKKIKVNADVLRRDEILQMFSKVDNSQDRYSGGVLYFHFLTYEGFQTLVDEEFIGCFCAWNRCPGFEVFKKYMDMHPDARLGGFAVHINRDDYGITFDSIRGKSIDPQEIKEFRKIFHDVII